MTRIRRNMTHTDPQDSLQIEKEIEARRFFFYTLEWLLALLNRYSSSIQFDLVLIELGSDELGETFGAQEALNQLALFTTSLTNDFRKTDIITRYVTDYWIIVPYDSNIEQIQTKIGDIFQASEHQELCTINREVSIFTLPMSSADAMRHLTSAPEFLTYLKENKTTLAKEIYTLPAHELSAQE